MTVDLALDKVRFDADGLVPVVAQDARGGDVLMHAWANRDALERTLETGRMHYWSRSRGRLWQKGEESGHVQDVVRLALDCDGDTVLALVHQTGPACHTSTPTCFTRKADEAPGPVLAELARLVETRKAGAPEDSYTRKLLDNPKSAGRKVNEEALELVLALQYESDARVAEEAADLLYHALVACAGRGVSWDTVLGILEARRR